LYVNKWDNPLANASEVIDNPHGKFILGVTGYREPSENVLGVHRVLSTLLYSSQRYLQLVKMSIFVTGLLMFSDDLGY
jgi:hypothetical protein